jgi:hypothetical protein
MGDGGGRLHFADRAAAAAGMCTVDVPSSFHLEDAAADAHTPGDSPIYMVSLTLGFTMHWASDCLKALLRRTSRTNTQYLSPQLSGSEFALKNRGSKLDSNQ